MTYITSINTVKDTCGLSKLVPEAKILPFFDATHKTVKSILGKTLYDRLISEIEADITLATEDDLLELRDDYLIPFIAWETYKRSINRLYGEFDRNGAHYKNDSNTVQLDTDWKRKEEASATAQADIYQSTLLDFLDDNSGTGEAFEDYKTTTTDEQGERIDRTDMGGIYTPRTRPRRQWR